MSNKLRDVSDDAIRLRDLMHGINTLAGEGEITESLLTLVEAAEDISKILVDRINQARVEK